MSKDLIGNRYGKLVVQNSYVKDKKKRYCICKCDCGNTKQIRADALTSGSTKSCGCIKPGNPRTDLTGKTFGRLTVLSYSHTTKDRVAHYLCECSCGVKKVISNQSLKKGVTVSCGCYHSDIIKTHNESKTRLYSIWHHIKDRCYNPNHIYFHNYGGRGIIMCDSWKSSYENFREWAINNGYDDSLTLDRKDNNSSYCPENCRWATRKEQARNRRNNKLVEYNGKKMSVYECAELIGMCPSTLESRLKSPNFTFEEAISKPVKGTGYNNKKRKENNNDSNA